MYSVYGIGNPLMDQVVHGDFALLRDLGAAPGSMNLIDESQRTLLHAGVCVHASIPGGSCANTLRGLAWIGGIAPPLYAGAVGDDLLGASYEAGLEDLGVRTQIVRKKGMPTGTSTIVVTQDHERTMFTYLGACRGFSYQDCPSDLPEARYLYFTAYMWDTENQRDAVKRRVVEARTRGMKVAFDLADPYAVGRYREDLLEWIPGNVDVLLGNRQEIRLMFGSDGTEEGKVMIGRAAELAPLVAMKTGPEGCVINREGTIVESPAVDVVVVDTIGAGDFFAAGLLYGLISDLPLAKTATLANAMGAAIVSVEGCSLRSLQREVVLAYT